MKGIRLASIAAVVAPALIWAAPAQADPDTDFAKELQRYGIYGQKDYNAWIGKIACKRLDRGVDHEPTSRRNSSPINCCAAAAPNRPGSSSARATNLLPRQARS